MECIERKEGRLFLKTVLPEDLNLSEEVKLSCDVSEEEGDVTCSVHQLHPVAERASRPQERHAKKHIAEGAK